MVVLDGGVQTSVQDYPGRLGLWSVGVPPSGPMDDLAFCLANRLLGNPEGAPGLEMTITGPTVRFAVDTVIALTGAAMVAKLDGAPVPFWRAVHVPAGAILKLGALRGRGSRAYLAVRGGFDVPEYLGSKSTFMLGRFGGHGGRTLRAGDVLHLADGPIGEALELTADLIPTYPEIWEIGVLYGPHGAPDFFTEADIDEFFSATWKVHYNSDRTGIRLVGPKPTWARRDGGEAGLHPSNIHDTAYAIGTIDYTQGICLSSWVPMARAWEGSYVLQPSFAPSGGRWDSSRPGIACAFGASTRRLRCSAKSPGRAPRSPKGVVYRRAGDEYLLVEYGPCSSSISRCASGCMPSCKPWSGRMIPGIIDLTPGIRSLQVHYDPARLSTTKLLDLLKGLERDLPRVDEMEVPTRVVHLPLSWEDPATLLAIEKYTRSVRADAPWCPSNIEFIRRINGLAGVDEVKQIVFQASYLVLGLGDVYLGAPVATPMDPRHRLVTTKYNPARTWTPENAVGIGGAYLCIYGMEGPGGYQFVGRTLQVWNTYRQTEAFRDQKPYLLRFFDQIRFYPVDADELLRMRASFPYGGVPVKIEEETLRYRDYKSFLEDERLLGRRLQTDPASRLRGGARAVARVLQGRTSRRQHCRISARAPSPRRRRCQPGLLGHAPPCLSQGACGRCSPRRVKRSSERGYGALHRGGDEDGNRRSRAGERRRPRGARRSREHLCPRGKR